MSHTYLLCEYGRWAGCHPFTPFSAPSFYHLFNDAAGRPNPVLQHQCKFNKSSSRGLLLQEATDCPPTSSSFIGEFYEFATYFNDDERRHGQSVRRHSESNYLMNYLIGSSSRAALLPQQALSARHLLPSTLFPSRTSIEPQHVTSRSPPHRLDVAIGTLHSLSRRRKTHEDARLRSTTTRYNLHSDRETVTMLTTLLKRDYTNLELRI